VIEPFVRSWLSAERADTDRDALYQQSLLAAIAADRETVSHDVVEGALSLGWHLSGWHVGMLIVPDEPVGQSRRPALIEQFAGEMERHGLPRPIAVDRGDSWLAWVSLDHEPAAAFNRQLLRSVRVAAAATDGGWRVAIGIGRASRGPAGLADTLQEARDAADLARSSRFRPMVEHIDELGVAKLLATWQRSEITQAFADAALGPLRDSPKLLDTLRAFLESGGSVVDAATVLGVHRNTVATRLGQIEATLGVTLSDSSQRLALQVACRALS
jgi:sugar diacid utilization regulator